jgi:hypothetical protein
MSLQSETPEVPQAQSAPSAESVQVEAKTSGKKTTTAPSAAQLRADQAKVSNRIALIKALGSNIGANVLGVGLVIVLAIAVWKDSKEAYAPICALLGTLVGIWLKGKEPSDSSKAGG